MRVLLIGASSQTGQEILRLVQDRAKVEVIPLQRPQVDVTSPETLERVFKRYNSQAVINLAAFHQVDRCESEPEQTLQTNVLGAMNVARQCNTFNARLIHFSTDYVMHEEDREQPFTESDLPLPRSVYAVSKLAGERMALAYAPNAVVLRTCGLYSSFSPAGGGRNFVQTMLALAKSGKAIRVVDDQICTPSWARSVAETALDLLDHSLRGVVHATCQGQCSWYEFTKTLFELTGLQADLSPTTTRDYNAPAARPPYSVLENARLQAARLDRLPHWKEALRLFVEEGAWRENG